MVTCTILPHTTVLPKHFTFCRSRIVHDSAMAHSIFYDIT